MVPVDIPPKKSPKPRSPRISELQRQVLKAAEVRGQWFLVASYTTRNGAYNGRKIIRGKEWDWPVVVHAVSTDQNSSELYVKVLEVNPTRKNAT